MCSNLLLLSKQQEEIMCYTSFIVLLQFKVSQRFKSINAFLFEEDHSIPYSPFISKCLGVFDLFLCVLCTACVTWTQWVMCVTPPPTEASRWEGTHSGLLLQCTACEQTQPVQIFSLQCNSAQGNKPAPVCTKGLRHNPGGRSSF